MGDRDELKPSKRNSGGDNSEGEESKIDESIVADSKEEKFMGVSSDVENSKGDKSLEVDSNNKKIRMRIFGDSPTTEDGLGFDSYVNILLDAINNFDAESPLTIGIHGSWGCGKTSLMKMLEKKLSCGNEFKTIWFNAWVYGRDEPIGLVLLQQVLTEFQKEEENKEKLNHLVKNVGRLFTDTILKKIAGISLEDAKEIFKNNIEVKSTLRDDFKTMVRECLQDKKLVVFIDDLDRCLPEKTIEILEVIKLFLDVPKCVFVIGAARELIEQGIEVRYRTKEQGTPIKGKDYIEKIIQIPFILPPIREDNMTGFIESLGIDEIEKEYAGIVAKGTDCNPRKVKLFLNMLRMRQAIADKSGGELKPVIAAKLFVIEYTFPEFYRAVVNYINQDFLFKLEKLAKGEVNKELKNELRQSELMKEYHENEKLKNLLEEKPYFNEINLEPYIYLSGTKISEDSSGFSESLLDELLSGDGTKVRHAANIVNKLVYSDKQEYLDILTEKLKNKDRSVRENATLAFSWVIGDSKVIELLIHFIEDKDEDFWVRRSAGTAIAKTGINSITPLLKTLKNKNGDVREIVIYALGEINDERVVPYLIKGLKDRNARVRRTSILSLGIFAEQEIIARGNKEVIKQIISCSKDKAIFVRSAVASSLGYVGEKGDLKIIKCLKTGLKDKSAEVRGGAIQSLIILEGTQIVDDILVAIKDSNWFVRIKVVEALPRNPGLLENPQIFELLERVLRNDKSVHVRGEAAQAINCINDKPKSLKILLDVLEKDIDISWEVVRIFGDRVDNKAVKPLIKRLKDPSNLVREEVANALGKIGDSRAIEPLTQLLNDEYETKKVIKSAKKAINKIKSKQNPK